LDSVPVHDRALSSWLRVGNAADQARVPLGGHRETTSRNRQDAMLHAPSLGAKRQARRREKDTQQASSVSFARAVR
jgi:hypothetical protein